MVSISLPTLAERLEDIPLLVEHCVQTLNPKASKSIKGLSPSAMGLLMRHRWPGNVRELENAIEYAFIRSEGEIIMPKDLPEVLRSEEVAESLLDAGNPLYESQRSVLVATLKKVNGNKGMAAERLGISRTTLWRKMKKYDLS